jgi:exonuclease III
MKLLSWNCRGLGKPAAVRALRQLIHSHQPDIIFLTETKLQGGEFLSKANSFGNRLLNHFFVDCTLSNSNRSGGLAIFWSKDVNISIIGYNERMIDCNVDCGATINSWRATGIYGYSNSQQKPKTCELITNLSQTNSHDNWLLFGDFNLISNSNEKQGGRTIDDNNANLFKDTLNNCNLIDLGYQGNPFTWSNNQEGNFHIKERLDRFCASSHWISKFPRCTNYHLLNYMSDHNPILLVFGTNHDFRDDSHPKHLIKRFENIWLHDQNCTHIVKNTWDQTSGDTGQKLRAVMDNTASWGKRNYGNIPKEVKSIQDKLQGLRSLTPSKDLLSQIHQLETKMDELIHKEEIWWAQRAKSNWLNHGDKNSKYFHYKASQRKRKKTINFIKDTDGSSKTQNKEIQEVFLKYFQEIFTSSNPTNFQETMQVVANKVSPQMRDYLNQDFTAAEVSYATHQLKGNAAPGPDGLNANFYHTYWDIIGGDIIDAALNILNHGGNPTSYNDTFICLIPKNNNPTNPADFRPIALCNVMLKIITKTIANRIKGILPEIISPQQSVFLPGRLISDNTIIAFETFHHLKHNNNKKKGYVGVKLDMAKAYDRLEWTFIDSTLTTMGFPRNLVQTIMRCITSVSFSILVNGQPSNKFIPHRGIRQGDPLSPYLFILCADVFSNMITNRQDQNLINGIQIAQHAPKISHLFFADDSLIFCIAKKEEALQLKDIF